MLDEFYTKLTEDKDDPIEENSSVSYNEAIQLCNEFINGDEENKSFYVWAKKGIESNIYLERKADEKPSISISLVLAVG